MKPLKRLLKLVIAKLECSSSQPMVSGWAVGGEELCFLKRAGHWQFAHAPASI